jgi:hypothetical protein
VKTITIDVVPCGRCEYAEIAKDYVICKCPRFNVIARNWKRPLDWFCADGKAMMENDKDGC